MEKRVVLDLPFQTAALVGLMSFVVPSLCTANDAEISNETAVSPNILVIWGDDVGIDNISVYNLGMMG